MIITPPGLTAASAAVIPLNCLINVLIQRITAVGSDDDIAGSGLNLTELFEKFPTFDMGSITIPGHRMDDFFFGIDDHINHEGQLGSAGGVEHIDMKGIAFNQAGAGFRMGNEFAAMIGQHTDPAGNTRQHTFASPGKTGKEMGLNKAFRNQQIRFSRQPVDDQLATRGQGSDFEPGCCHRRNHGRRFFRYRRWSRQIFPPVPPG